MVTAMQDISTTIDAVRNKITKDILGKADILELLARISTLEAMLPEADSQDFWSLLSALRGPDFIDGFNTDYLKDFTTGRIRAILQIGTRFGVSRTAPLTQVERLHRDDLLNRPGMEHFRRHYYCACSAIEHLKGYDLLDEIDLKKPSSE